MALTYTRNDLIARAMRLTGRFAAGEPLSADTIHDVALTLNLMLKEWQTYGWYLWLEEEATCFFADGQYEYTIGSAASDDNATLSHVKTEIYSAASAAQTSIVLDSTSGMTAGDYIGIEEESNYLQWTTIGSVDTASQVTLASGLTYSTVVDNHVYAYTTKMQRPLAVRNARLEYEDQHEVTLQTLSRDEWFDLADKTTEGVPVNIYWNPKKSSGKFYVWPRPSTVKHRLRFTACMPFTEFTSATQAPDFPEEWYDALTWCLAAEVAPEFGVAMDRITYLETKAMDKKMRLQVWDQEDAPVRFVMDME